MTKRRDFIKGGAFGMAAAGMGMPAIPIPQDPEENPYWGYGQDERVECEVTSADIQGPFYRADAPWETNLAEGIDGRPLRVHGIVEDSECHPIAEAVVDLWQADGDGHYDNDNPRNPPPADLFRLRGRTRTNAEGGYEFRTVWPGRYLIGRDRWRPAHVHFKASATGFVDLTTQMYFQGDPENADDDWFRESRAVEAVEGDDGVWVAEFRIVLARA